MAAAVAPAVTAEGCAMEETEAGTAVIISVNNGSMIDDSEVYAGMKDVSGMRGAEPDCARVGWRYGRLKCVQTEQSFST